MWICTSRCVCGELGAKLHQLRGEIPADHRALEDEHRHIADAQLIFELRPLGEGAEGDTGAAGHGDPEHRRDPLRPIGREQSDAGLFGHAARDQRSCDFARLLPDLRVRAPDHRTRRRVKNQRLFVAIVATHLTQESTERQCTHGLIGKRSASNRRIHGPSTAARRVHACAHGRIERDRARLERHARMS